MSFARLWVGVGNPCLIKFTVHDPALDWTHDHEARRGVGLEDECALAGRFRFAIWPERYANSFWVVPSLAAVLEKLCRLPPPLRLTLDLRRAILDLEHELTPTGAEACLDLLVELAQAVDALPRTAIIPAT